MRYSSLTAIGTTVTRASFTGSLCRDALASRFLSLPLRAFSSSLRQFPWLRQLARTVADRFEPGLVTYLAYRTEHFDRMLDTALDRGIDQVVILRAGFDSRAWRFDDSRHIDFFEVDRPSTQNRKRRLVRQRFAAYHSPVFVPVDLGTDNLVHALIAAGFDSSRRTFFLWEGAASPQDEGNVRVTLSALRSVAAEGSELAVDLTHPGLLAELGWEISELFDEHALRERYSTRTPSEPVTTTRMRYLVSASASW